MPKRAVSTTKNALHHIDYRLINKEKIKAYNDYYVKTHDMAARQRIYDRARAEYKSFARALLRMLNNLYDEPTTSV